MSKFSFGQLFSFNRKEDTTSPVKTTFKPESFTINLSTYEAPKIKESRYGDWMEYGEKNDFPQVLMEFLDTCTLHAGIVTAKSAMVAGGEILVDGIPLADWRKTNPVDKTVPLVTFLNNSYAEDWTSLKNKLALDRVISGSYCLKVTWSLDFSKISKVEHIPFAWVRPGKKDEDGCITKYFVSSCWSKNGRRPKEDEITEYQAFDVECHLPKGELPEGIKNIDEYPFDHEQILFVKNHWPGIEYFGRPTYQSCITDIRTLATLSQYFNNSTENGFTPSVTITYLEPAGTDEEAAAIATKLKKQFSVTGNARKIAVLFANSKETAPIIQPLDVKNLDGTLITLQESVQSNIVTGHAVTSPELVGITVAGQLGNGDVELKYRIFYNSVVRPDKEAIENTLNYLMEFNGITSRVTFKENNPTI